MPETPANKWISLDFLYPLLVSILVFIGTLILSGCAKEETENLTADPTRVAGTYTVADTDENNEIKSYEVTITQSADGNAIVEIGNFGNFMYAPLKATLKGNAFDIPQQSFKGKTMTIALSGSGTVQGDVLNFKYTLETDDDYIFEHNCAASKKETRIN